MDYDRESQGRSGGGFGESTGTGGSTGGGYSGIGRPFEETGTRAGSYDRSFQGGRESEGMTERIGEKVEEGKEAVAERVEEGKQRVGQALDSGRSRVASQLDRAGDRLHDRARGMEEHGGMQRRAGKVADRAGDALDTSAEYLRTHDIDEMRDDLENTIRERPLLSVGVAIGAGFLLARILRD